MYDINKKRWVETPMFPGSEPNLTAEQEQLRFAFADADRELAKLQNGYKSMDAVYKMQSLAKSGSPDACLAMYEMFTYGWLVKKSSKQALFWLKAAAENGSLEARRKLSSLSPKQNNLQNSLPVTKKKRSKIPVIIVVLLIVALLAASAIIFLPKLSKSKKSDKKNNAPEKTDTEVIVADGTESKKAENPEKYGEEISKIISQHDDDDIKSGNAHPARIVLVYTGYKLDLSKFDIETVLQNDESFIIQFKELSEAEKCLSYLNGLEGTVAATIDSYISSQADDDSLSPNASENVTTQSNHSYHSKYTGYDYYSWGVEMMGFDQYSAYLKSFVPSNKKIVVGVVDTGILPNKETKNRILDGYSPFNKSKGKCDYNGHGTHVSGTILDCTRGLNIYVMPFMVFAPDSDGASLSIIFNGINVAIAKKVDVINMSLGGPRLDGEDNVYKHYIQKAINAGIVVVVAAGNESIPAKDTTPAFIEDCITVSAINQKGKYTSFTNYGSSVDVCAPGENIYSYFSQNNKPTMASLDGTSMAAPHISALAAMMQLEFDETPEMIQFYIKKYCKPYTKDTKYYGCGLPMASYFVEKK